jgi:hypothetical protein
LAASAAAISGQLRLRPGADEHDKRVEGAEIDGRLDLDLLEDLGLGVSDAGDRPDQ